jgi:hypothetical protein
MIGSGKHMGKDPWWRAPLKYFLHGVSFSLLMLVLGLAWAILFVILAAVGFLIGLIIGLIVLFILVGGLNSFLTHMIWGIPIKTDWKSLLAHGFAFIVALLVAEIPSFLVTSYAPGLATTAVLFIIDAFIDGFIGKNVACHWEEEYGEGVGQD